MDIENFKKLTLEEKLSEIKYNGQILGAYERNSENAGALQISPGTLAPPFSLFLS